MGQAVKAPQEHEQGEAPGCLTEDLSWLLSQAHFALAAEVTAAIAPLGLSPRGFHVLATAMTGEHTQRELADTIGLDKTTMVVTLDELEEAGLAERRPSKIDRRARVVAVTKAGERKVAEAKSVIAKVQADVLDTLPARERKALLDSLTTLICNRLADPVACNPPLRRRGL